MFKYGDSARPRLAKLQFRCPWSQELLLNGEWQFCCVRIERSVMWSSGKRKSGKHPPSFSLQASDITLSLIDANASLRLIQAKDPEQVVRRGPTSKQEYQLNISSVLKCGSHCAPLMSVSTETIHSRAEGSTSLTDWVRSESK